MVIRFQVCGKIENGHKIVAHVKRNKFVIHNSVNLLFLFCCAFVWRVQMFLCNAGVTFFTSNNISTLCGTWSNTIRRQINKRKTMPTNWWLMYSFPPPHRTSHAHSDEIVSATPYQFCCSQNAIQLVQYGKCAWHYSTSDHFKMSKQRTGEWNAFSGVMQQKQFFIYL